MAHLQTDFLASRPVGDARRKAVATFLGDFADWLAPRSLAHADARDLDAFLSAMLDAGFHPNTVRKWLVMARAFYRWLYEQDVITAATMLAIRELRPPRGS